MDDASTQRTDGVAAVGSGSSNVMNPMAVNGVPSGPRIGNWPILELINCGGNLTWHYRCEDQLGTLKGMTDEAGIRVAEFDTSKYGEVYHKHILFDGRASHIGVVTADPSTDITRIELVPGVFFTEDVIGAVLRATNSETAATAVVTSLDPFGVYIEFDDPSGAVADVINSDGQFLIFDNRQTDYTGYPTTGGTWSNVELFTDPQFGELTILTSADGLFDEFMVGWQVQVNAAVPVYLDIVTTTGDGLCVSGDASALVTAEETEFCIIHPVGVNPQNGATQTDPCQPESRYLWGGGYYLPPIVGFEMWHDGVFGIHGNQPGNNKSGQHDMWNRIYDVDIGRWTTTDSASDPWENLKDYAGVAPVEATDPNGLGTSSRTQISDCGEHTLDATPSFIEYRQWGPYEGALLIGMTLKGRFTPNGNCCCNYWEVVVIERIRQLKSAGDGTLDWVPVYGGAQSENSQHMSPAGWYVASTTDSPYAARGPHDPEIVGSSLFPMETAESG